MADASAVSAYNPSALSFEPVPDPDSHVSCLERGTRRYGPSLATFIRDRLRRQATKNFEGREYITKHTLSEVLSKEVVEFLLQESIPRPTDSMTTGHTLMESREDISHYIETEARVLLALCIFVDSSMRTFLALLAAGVNDDSLPLIGKCPVGVDTTDFHHIVQSQGIFLPHDIFLRPTQHALPEDTILPLKFDRKTDLIGCGAYSDVFQVEVDNVQYRSPLKQERTSIYALKRFKENPWVEKSFRREYTVLQELTKIPHDHILLHLAAWSQCGVFYMLFPQARCSLRTFMDEVQYPNLTAENVVWFFHQLVGLADAVRHLHALDEFRQNRAAVESGQAAIHNDIKPGNILVFDSNDGSPGLLKISDFGCGTIETSDQTTATRTQEIYYGTPEYENPDRVIYKQTSKPNDIWALGCVFLEFTDWFLVPRTAQDMTFQSQRYTGAGGPSSSPAFWWRNAIPKHHNENQLQLTMPVGKKLCYLERDPCAGKQCFQLLLTVLWHVLEIDRKDRWPAERVYREVIDALRQAHFDLATDRDNLLAPVPPPPLVPTKLRLRRPWFIHRLPPLPPGFQGRKGGIAKVLEERALEERALEERALEERALEERALEERAKEHESSSAPCLGS